MAMQPSPTTLRSFRFTKWRFDETVKKVGACHVWLGAKNSAKSDPGRQYGLIRRDGRRWMAHHVAFFYANDRWPRSEVARTCGNTLCVRPDHLREVNPNREVKPELLAHSCYKHLEREIISLRRHGLGCQMIRERLAKRHDEVPSIPTILKICCKAGLGPERKHADPAFTQARNNRKKRLARKASRKTLANRRNLRERVLGGDQDAVAELREARRGIWASMLAKTRKTKRGCWINTCWKAGTAPSVFVGDGYYAVPTAVLLLSCSITNPQAREHEYMSMCGEPRCINPLHKRRGTASDRRRLAYARREWRAHFKSSDPSRSILDLLDREREIAFPLPRVSA